MLEHIPIALTMLFAMIISLTVHEAAHAAAAFVQGDSTARDEGRLSLSPIPHIDPIGTLVFPAIGALLSVPIIGWAKPVPVDERMFKNPRLGSALVAAAGPISNLIFAFVCLIVLDLYRIFASEFIPPGSFLYPLTILIKAIAQINAILAFFNLLPLPPLDGAGVLRWFLPEHWAEAYESYVAPYSMFILMILLFGGGLGWVWILASRFLGIASAISYAITSPLGP